MHKELLSKFIRAALFYTHLISYVLNTEILIYVVKAS